MATKGVDCNSFEKGTRAPKGNWGVGVLGGGVLQQLFLGHFRGVPWSLNLVSRLTWKSPLHGTSFVWRSWMAHAVRETHSKTKILLFMTSFPLSKSERSWGGGARGSVVINSFILSGVHVKVKKLSLSSMLQSGSSFPISPCLSQKTFFLNIFSSLDSPKNK